MSKPKTLRSYDDALQEQLRERAEKRAKLSVRASYVASVKCDGNVLTIGAFVEETENSNVLE